MSIGKSLAAWMRDRPKLVVLLDKEGTGAPRVHPRWLPKDAGTKPRAVVFHKISDVSEGSLAGVVQLSNARLQFDCYGRTPDEADTIREQVKKELDGFFQGYMGALRVFGVEHDGDRDDTEAPEDGTDNPRFICSCDYLFTYQRPTE